MFEDTLLSFLKLVFSVETIVIAVGYLTACHILISRVKEMTFSLILQCFWAVCFTFLFCRIFFRGTQAFASVASFWPMIGGALLVLSFVPAFVIRFVTSRANFPPLLGLFEIFWLVGVAQAIVWSGGLLIVPPAEMLIVLVVIAIVVTAALGFFLIGISKSVFGLRAMKEGIVFFRLAGMFTVYIPLCLYGAFVKSLFAR